MVFDYIYKNLENKMNNSNEIATISLIGNQGAGKTYFNREFSAFLKDKKITSIPWNCDMYTKLSRPEKRDLIRELKGKDSLWVEKIFYQYDKNSALEHLIKIKNTESFSQNNLYSQITGEKDLSINLEFYKEKVVCGIGNENLIYDREKLWFLFDSDFFSEEKFRKYTDLVIFLHSDKEIRKERVRERCLKANPPFNLNEELFDATNDWLEDYFNNGNRKLTDIVIDNNDYRNRKLISIN